MRPRLRSRSGCATCRYRRVKCDEVKPTCGLCARSKLSCVQPSASSLLMLRAQRIENSGFQLDRIPAIRKYGTPRDSEKVALQSTLPTTQMAVPESSHLSSPLYQTQHLPISQFRNQTERAVLSRIPDLVAMSLMPIAGSAHYDATEIMQMAFSNLLVRDSLVACYSYLLAYKNPRYEPNHAAWGRALGTVRDMLNNSISDQATLFTLQVSVLLLGLLEHAGPDLSGDLSLHWKAATILAGKFRDLFHEQILCIPENLYILVLEMILYEACVCMFTKNYDPMPRLWTYCSAYQTLMKVNPPGDKQLERSPLIAGPYEIFEMVFQVMTLFRKPGLTMADQTQLNIFEEDVCRVQHDLRINLGPTANTNRDKQGRRIEVLNLFCISLLICISDLKQSSEQYSRRLPILVQHGLDVFLQMSVAYENNSALMWPVQVLGCAIEEDDRFDEFFRKFNMIKLFVDPGHSRRAESLWERVKEIRASQPTEAERELRSVHGCFKSSRPMLLFRQRGGILSREF